VAVRHRYAFGPSCGTFATSGKPKSDPFASQQAGEQLGLIAFRRPLCAFGDSGGAAQAGRSWLSIHFQQENYMKKIFVAAAMASLSLAVHAEGWRFLPANEANFAFDPAVAGTLNYVDPDGHSSDTSLGVDLNFNCALIQDPQDRIRTHLQFGHFSKDGTKANAFELSPRYTVPISKGLFVGVGPSLAVYDVDVPGASKILYGVGIAGGIEYRVGSLYLGADARYHDTESRGGVDFDNLTLGLKAGINF
jgi:hypothetical protein